MLNHVRSFLSVFIVQSQKIVDQTWRNVFGLPTMSRSAITPNIYLGGQYKIRSLAKMKKIGITAIVNMRISSLPNVPLIKSFNTLHLPTRDYHAPSIEQLKKGLVFMTQEIKENGKVYVHCRQGEGRGPSMVAAYLMSTGLTLDDAITLIKKVRTFIHPNKEQMNRLKELELLLFNER